jgi:hypothetical protein
MLLEGFCLCVKPIFSGYARYSDVFLTSTGEMAAVVKCHLKYTRFRRCFLLLYFKRWYALTNTLPADSPECMTLSTKLRARSGQLLYSFLAPPALFRPTTHLQTSRCLCKYNYIRLS